MVLAATWRVKSGECDVSGTRALQLIETWNHEGGGQRKSSEYIVEVEVTWLMDGVVME